MTLVWKTLSMVCFSDAYKIRQFWFQCRWEDMSGSFKNTGLFFSFFFFLFFFLFFDGIGLFFSKEGLDRQLWIYDIQERKVFNCSLLGLRAFLSNMSKNIVFSISKPNFITYNIPLYNTTYIKTSSFFTISFK